MRRPSSEARENRDAFGPLLIAASLKDTKGLENDAGWIDERRFVGNVSAARHVALKAIVEKSASGYWGSADRLSYEFRETRPFFK
ncbi:hypothetical protein [Paludisphaera sp.]|uniref:hypothetical protein n=1 Tax=Paludisphaera sp. TaxID=2017432 RepID=UPI00301D94B8